MVTIVVCFQFQFALSPKCIFCHLTQKPLCVTVFMRTVLPQNGLTHSHTNIDEFVPEDELDAGFLDEDGSSRGRKRTNKPAAKKQPAPAQVEQDVSEESDR